MTAARRLAQRVLAVALLAAAAGCTRMPTPGGESTPEPVPSLSPSATTQPVTTPTESPTLSPTATPTLSPTATPTLSPTTSATPAAPSSGLLREGDSGPAVVALQERLASLGYWVGVADGKFGDATQQAVFAFQKVAGLDRDGVVGSQTAAALALAGRPTARPTQARTVEIDLRQQVLFLVADDQVLWAFNTSTGGGYVYYQDGRRHVAVTPTGQFTVTRQVDGWDHSPLGWLWRPKYFNGGIAVHGYEEVPPYPASHGCVRVSVEAMNWLWTTGAMAVGTPVVVY